MSQAHERATDSRTEKPCSLERYQPGARWDGRRTHFFLASEHATAAEVCFFERPDSTFAYRTVELSPDGRGAWRARVPGAEPGTLYGYRVHGPWRPRAGHRFDSSKLLIDPRALAVTGEPRPDPALFSHRPGGDPNHSYAAGDSAGAMPKCVVVDPTFDWQGLGSSACSEGARSPRVPLDETVFYETHPKGITRLHPQVPPQLRGSYLGLAQPAVLDHLRTLGITTVELMPVHQSAPEAHLLRRGQRNYWGYSPVSFFAPAAAYASDTLAPREPATGATTGPGPRWGRQVREIQTLVRELHRSGLEVVVDVVYNHTAEGGVDGPTYGFRGIDNASYYRPHPSRRDRYVDFTGCGNTLDIRQPLVLELVLDSLRYWIEILGVDGFRFDLATSVGRAETDFDSRAPLFRAIAEDPVLSRAKWIAEPWDLGPGGYRLGAFPAGWSEWNDRFRDTARRFWRGEAHGPITAELATRLAGSRDIFASKGPLASINYVISHDGFTLADLVSHDHKHNEANGEDNRDGTENNLSRNWGVEGPTDDPGISAQRSRTRRNLMATLLLAQGVPLLQHGDEIGRTQGGNNNPYCQDNEIAWTDWSSPDEDFLDFVRHLLRLRRRYPQLRRPRFLASPPEGVELEDFVTGSDLGGGPTEAAESRVLWLSLGGQPLSPQDWQQPEHGAFAMALLDRGGPALFLLINGRPEAAPYRLPGWARDHPVWLLLDTAEPRGRPASGPAGGRRGDRSDGTLEGRSIRLLVADFTVEPRGVRRASTSVIHLEAMPGRDSESSFRPHPYRAIHRANIAQTPEWQLLDGELREAVRVVSTVLPFRTNAYVLRELIDWAKVPDDPMFQLTFVQKGMLDPADYARMARLLDSGAPKSEVEAAANEIRATLRPHPAGQATHNVPRLDGQPLGGMQHKYRETVLFFPSAGQTCHAYCTFCFRWAQFVGPREQKFEARESGDLARYLRAHPEVSDLLITGGDPMVMGAKVLRRYLRPLLEDGSLEHVRHLRIGTKSVAYWPHRFVTDPDADDVLRLFEDVVASGRHLAIMGHYNHPRELSTPVARAAIRRIRETGAQIRLQSPLVRHVNDDPAVWAELWRSGVTLGCVPYYLFVERDTGPKSYFQVPLEEAWRIFHQAYQQVSGLARTVRGPSMSALPGKVAIDGVAEIRGEKVFALQFLQAREPDWVRRPFFARYDPAATWLDDLEPAFGEALFFFEKERPDLIPPSRRHLALALEPAAALGTA